MRFIQFLVEADKNGVPYQNDWIRKAQKADRQRARRATAQRGEENKQKMQAATQKPRGRMVNGKFVPYPDQQGSPPQQPNQQAPQQNLGLPQKPAGQMDTLDFDTGEKLKGPKDHPAGLEQRSPSRGPDVVELNPQEKGLGPFIKIASGDRAKALEMISLIGAIYKAKKTNPRVQLRVPKIVTGSSDPENMEKLFNAVKRDSLPQLSAAYQEIKKAAATGQAGQTGQTPASGTQNVPATPNQTPGGKTVLQSLLNRIKQAAKSLSPADMAAVKKEAEKAAKNAKPNPSNKQQPIGKPVVTSG